MTGIRSMLTNLRWGAALAVALASLVAGCSAPAPSEATEPVSAPAPVGASVTAPTAPAPAPSQSAEAPAPPLAARTTPGRVEEAMMTSAALGADKRFYVYLPGGYDAGSTRFPVIYLLHGLGGTESDWIRHGQLPAAADAMGLPAIVVMPDGDASFYANAASTPSIEACMRQRPPFSAGEAPVSFCVERARYDEYMVTDLVGHVDATYRTIAKREARAITGISMGGFGAMSLAMRHPGVYSSAASHSGLLSLLYEGPHPYRSGKVRRASAPDAWGGRFPKKIRTHIQGIFGTDLDAWRAHDPAVLAERLEPGALSLFIDCGEQDGFMLYDDAKHVHDILKARDVEHSFHLGPGGHSYALWKERLPKSLAFHVEHFGEVLR